MPRSLPIYPACPVCGDPAVNPATLAVRWWWDDDRRWVVGRFVPEQRHGGSLGTLHGGVLSSLLDECMVWACAVESCRYCMTGELKVRFKVPAPLGEPLDVTGRVLTGWGRLWRAAAEVTSAKRGTVATAAATFSALPLDQSLRLHQALRLEPGDLDILR